MDNAYQMIYYGISHVFEWLQQIEYEGITVFQVCIFGLVLTLIWRFALSPIFGSSGGSLSVSASDLVSHSKSSKRHEQTKAYRARKSEHWSKREEYYKIRGDYFKSRTKK